MKKWFSAGIFALASLAIIGVGVAGDQDFTLTNKTGYAIDQVYVSPSAADDWEEDILGQDILANGDHVNIHFSRNTSACKFDLKVIYVDDGSSAEWEDIDLCSVEKITIRWNKKTGDTTATFE